MYPVFKSLLFRLDAERAHHLATSTARFVQAISPSIIQPLYAFDHPVLHQKIWGVPFRNPVGLAAGFDKNAQLVRFWDKAGFGFCEIGSVSARASQGNNKPRAFRLPSDKALINRMGLNNDGAEEVSQRLKKLNKNMLPPLGINIAKTHDPSIMGEGALLDFRHTYRVLAPLASYVVLNISCPNTAEGKTFEDPESLDALLTAILSDRKEIGANAPLLVKLSPTFSQHVVFDSAIEEILSIVEQHRIDGLVATNTASDRQHLVTSDAEIKRIGKGGLSGAPLTHRTTRLVKYLYEKTRGEIPIVAVGGIDSAETAYANIRAGASLVQLYTGLVYKGLGVVKKINKGLVRLLRQDGYKTISEAIGADVDVIPNPIREQVLAAIEV